MILIRPNKAKKGLKRTKNISTKGRPSCSEVNGSSFVGSGGHNQLQNVRAKQDYTFKSLRYQNCHLKDSI